MPDSSYEDLRAQLAQELLDELKANDAALADEPAEPTPKEQYELAVRQGDHKAARVALDARWEALRDADQAEREAERQAKIDAMRPAALAAAEAFKAAKALRKRAGDEHDKTMAAALEVMRTFYGL